MTTTCIEQQPGAIRASLDGRLHEGSFPQTVGLVDADTFELLEQQANHVSVTCRPKHRELILRIITI